MRIAAIAIVSFATISLFAQTQTKPQLSDKKMDFALWFKEASTEFPDKNTINFEVSGNPVKGYSKSQNLQFSSSEMTGTILQVRDEKSKSTIMKLKSGKMTGQATLKVNDEGGDTTFKSNSVSIEDDGESAVIKVPGALSVTSDQVQEGSNRSLFMSGSSGLFTLKSLATKDPDPFVSGTIEGPVTLKVNQISAGEKTVLYTLTGGKITMHSEGERKIIKIVGSVHVSSDTTDKEGKGFVGEMDVHQATITLDKTFNLIKLSTSGEPGTGQVREKVKKDGQ